MQHKKALRRAAPLLLAALAALLLGAQLAQAAVAVAWGDKGDNVIAVQRKLKQWGYYSGTVDGVFGQATYDAVTYFQRKNGLKADGVVGSTTAAALGIQLSGRAKASVAASGFNDSEVRLLARLIHGEARGEPYMGKVAVGAVVLNRVRHSSFPNTISGVIYQPGAFDCVSDGQINLNPDSESLRAARDAMNGWDPSGGCIYYYNPNTATSGWIWSRPIRLSIGKHNFAV
ncbi:MAG: spore cortex-lytic enzyme [Oscillospiraceae bacterium]|jgi:N-acetylmuramoyl-L-alanine amidase|nr:spore cortex-lytic enzyme [Oscillospiraceae bacterium]